MAASKEAVRVYWCVWCGGSENDEPMCPRCQRRKADLGWRIGESYYSTAERLPKSREAK